MLLSVDAVWSNLEQRQPGEAEMGVDHQNAEAVVQGNTEFALALFRQLRTREGNLFFSPYSISTALAMTYGGARKTTEAQMAQTLRYNLDQAQLHPAFALLEAELNAVQARGNVQLRVANALWPRVGHVFSGEYLALIKEYYDVLITALDYGDSEAARITINAWVEEKTEGKIVELIAPGTFDALTCLVLANAIYFKGDWAKPFNDVRTETTPFWVTPTEQVEVPMMSQVEVFGYSARPGLQVLKLPYAGDGLSMIVLLPDKLDGIAELEDALTAENLKGWTSHLRQVEVKVYLPRFRASSRFELSDTLKSMGMVNAFSGAADFSGMGDAKGLYISAVIHQAFVDVDEEGTEAAAATAVVMRMMACVGLPPPPPIFRADHPFIFLIQENHRGNILFVGRVANPMSVDNVE